MVQTENKVDALGPYVQANGTKFTKITSKLYILKVIQLQITLIANDKKCSLSEREQCSVVRKILEKQM